MTQGSSPGTSEISNATTRAGAAAAASLPPLIAERCLRTQFISEMVAPLFSSALLMPCLSARVTPLGWHGEQRRAAARNKAEHEIVFGQALHARKNAFGRLPPCGVRNGMARLDHLQCGDKGRRDRNASRPGLREVPSNDPQPPWPWPRRPCPRQRRSCGRPEVGADAPGGIFLGRPRLRQPRTCREEVCED